LLPIVGKISDHACGRPGKVASSGDVQALGAIRRDQFQRTISLQVGESTLCFQLQVAIKAGKSPGDGGNVWEVGVGGGGGEGGGAWGEGGGGGRRGGGVWAEGGVCCGGGGGGGGGGGWGGAGVEWGISFEKV